MDAALLIIDVQQALCTGQWAAYDVANVVDRINAVSARARATGVPVVLVQHEEDDGPLRHDTEGWQLHDRLAVDPGDWRLRKTACDAFHRTALADLLRERGVQRLVVCGMQSEFCVDSTVRGALTRGFAVQLVGDAHTTLDNGVLGAAEIIAHHNATIGNLGNYGPTVSVTPADAVLTAA